MQGRILQAIPQETVEQIASKSDSARVVLRQFTENLASDPQGTLSGLASKALEFGIKVAVVFVVYIIGNWLIKQLNKTFKKLLERKGTDQVLVNFLLRFIRISLTVLLVIALVGTLGVNTTSFAALLAAMGMAIGMALSGTMQNLAGGFIILAFKPFKAGDLIEAQGHIGKVQDVTFISTKIITPDNKTVFIPNGILSNGNITNRTSNNIRRVEWTISVEYGTDATECREKLLSLIKEDPRILDSGTSGAADPFAGLSELGESSIKFTVRAWVKTEDYWDVFFDFNNAVYTRLPDHGIKFPFPQMDIHVRTD